MAGEHIAKHHALAGEQVVKALKSRHFEACYCATKAEALEKALSYIPEGSSVGWGGSVSVEEIGLKEAVRSPKYKAIDRDVVTDPAEKTRLMKQCLLADVFLMGTNALSQDGELVNIDGTGNRVAALCYGPDSVIVIAGINKLAPTLDTAIARARSWASPINAARFAGIETPCAKTGLCGNCRSKDCICNQIVITRNSRPAGRIKVIVVGEELGY